MSPRQRDTWASGPLPLLPSLPVALAARSRKYLENLMIRIDAYVPKETRCAYTLLCSICVEASILLTKELSITRTKIPLAPTPLSWYG